MAKITGSLQRSSTHYPHGSCGAGVGGSSSVAGSIHHSGILPFTSRSSSLLHISNSSGVQSVSSLSGGQTWVTLTKLSSLPGAGACRLMRKFSGFRWRVLFSNPLHYLELQTGVSELRLASCPTPSSRLGVGASRTPNRDSYSTLSSTCSPASTPKSKATVLSPSTPPCAVRPYVLCQFRSDASDILPSISFYYFESNLPIAM